MGTGDSVVIEDLDLPGLGIAAAAGALESPGPQRDLRSYSATVNLTRIGLSVKRTIPWASGVMPWSLEKGHEQVRQFLRVAEERRVIAPDRLCRTLQLGGEYFL